MPFKDHFSARAVDYGRFRPRYPAGLFEHLAALAPGRRWAWDCATGNGQAALALARRFGQIIATDASRAQLAHAMPHPGVGYCAARAEHAPVAGASMDVITVAQAAHWFELNGFYAEARRVLRPGGVIALWCYGLFRIAPEVDALIRRFYADALGPYWPPERRWVETGYRDLPFPFTPLAAPAFEMRADWTLAQLVGYLGTWSAVQRYLHHRGHNPLPALAFELGRVWQAQEEIRTLRWPIHLLVGRAEERTGRRESRPKAGGAPADSPNRS